MLKKLKLQIKEDRERKDLFLLEYLVQNDKNNSHNNR